ncbi:MAG: TatD family hydrolase [Rhodocyclales bacterium]|jgi:TatD DNase family protein|nr:TatD family hydrolase [Rhodocyclales bacterium]
MLVDTHCHLDAVEFDIDRVEVAAAALRAGVDRIVVPSVERANFGAVASVCRDHAGCLAAYGIHPMYVERAREADLDALNETILRERPLAVGEIGLDHFVEPRDEAMQEFYFDAQLRIARDHGLPVLLHVRRAIDQVLKDLRRCRVPGGIAHAFNGSRQQADEFIKLGFKLGFGGAMTFPRATRIRELAATLPLESLVLETDAPDIPPEWKVSQDAERRVRNTPDQLPRIARTLADLRGISAQELADATTNNATAVLPGLARIH